MILVIDERLAQLCAGKVGSNKDLPVRICEEINCLGGIENLSVRSDFSVIGKLIRRLRYFIGERKRCADLPEIIYRGDYVEFGTLLIQSHLSLK